MDERQQFKQAIMPHLNDALTLARWLTGNIADAEDVVQDACIRAYRAIGSVQHGKSRAWLLAIVRNTAFTWLGKNRSRDVVLTDDESVFEQAGIQMIDRGDAVISTPETALIAKDEGDLIRRAIADLPVSYREVLVLREIEELSYREISEIMSIPIGTVMSRLSRARMLLIQRIDMTRAGKAGAM